MDREKMLALRVLILYYSGTGNTKFACDVVRLTIEKAGHEAIMREYTAADPDALGGYDLYCFAAPVYEWAPARNVEQFVGSMERLPGMPAFILTTSAGAKGQATPLFERMLRNKGLKVLGDFNLICPDSWGGTRRWSHGQDAKAPTAETVLELSRSCSGILDKAVALARGEDVVTPEYRVRPTGLYLASRLSRLARKADHKMGRKRVNNAKCTSCGVCVKNCPTGSITLDRYPRFSDACIACWRCINTCSADCITTRLDCGRHYKGIPRKEELLEEAGLL